MADGFVLRKMPDLKGEILVFTGEIIVCRKNNCLQENRDHAGQGRRKKAEMPRLEEDKEKKERK